MTLEESEKPKAHDNVNEFIYANEEYDLDNAHVPNLEISYAPFSCKEQLQLAHWFASENTTSSATDRLSQIPMYNVEGERINLNAAETKATIGKIAEHHPDLSMGEWSTIPFGKYQCFI